jgi:hypothetical protein
MTKTIFSTVEEAVAAVASPELIEMLRGGLIRIPWRRCDTAMENEIRRLLHFIESGGLRRTLEEQFQSTGKIELAFTQEAWKSLKEHMNDI